MEIVDGFLAILQVGIEWILVFGTLVVVIIQMLRKALRPTSANISV